MMEKEAMLMSLLITLIGSAGFWSILGKRMDNKYKLMVSTTNLNTAMSDMLLGLAHDRIVALGMDYIERGYITHDEYENLSVYLYRPYKEGLNGNGSAERIMNEVDKLPIKKHYEKEYYT